MLTKIYIDNFRSFVNFNFEPGPVRLILGTNGSGKSSFFEALWRLREVLVLGPPVYHVFTHKSLTRWDSRDAQTFEITVQGNNGKYVYNLIIEHHRKRGTAKVAKETLSYDSQALFSFIQGEVNLYRDDFSAGPKFPSDWNRSGLYNVPPRHDNTKLTWFRDWVETFCCVNINSSIEPSTDHDESRPNFQLTNFSSWYWHLLLENPDSTTALREELKNGVIEGFETMSLTKQGELTRSLDFELRTAGEGVPSTKEYSVAELSEGQRVLIKLYALAICAMQPKTTLVLDDPITHVSLEEVQPWLLFLLDRADDIDAQVIVSSHHPEIINYLARKKGVFFRRDGNGPVRVIPAQLDEESRLEPSELIARGWVDG